MKKITILMIMTILSALPIMSFSGGSYTGTTDEIHVHSEYGPVGSISFTTNGDITASRIASNAVSIQANTNTSSGSVTLDYSSVDHLGQPTDCTVQISDSFHGKIAVSKVIKCTGIMKCIGLERSWPISNGSGYDLGFINW